jgi:hypothetical protein
MPMRKPFTPLRVELIEGTGGTPRYRLIEPLVYSRDLDGDGLHVIVPAGFETDFASIPRMFWPLLPHDGPWAQASVVHDYLYERGTCSRFLADAIFRDAMAALGVPWYRRVPMYYAVRLFGGLAKRFGSADRVWPFPFWAWCTALVILWALLCWLWAIL